MAPFKRSEYQLRIQKTKDKMEELGIDILIISDLANMNYITGYDSVSPYSPKIVLLSIFTEEPIWIGHEIDVNNAKFTSILSDDNIIGYPDYYVYSSDKHPMNFVSDFFKEQGWQKKNIGLEMDNYYFNYKCYKELTQYLPEAEFTDTDFLVNWVRIIKSAQEIEYMKQAGAVAKSAMETAIEKLATEGRGYDFDNNVYQVQISNAEDFNEEYIANIHVRSSGEKVNAPHSAWNDKPHCDDTTKNLELTAYRNRYNCPISRSVYSGASHSQKLKEVAKIAMEGMELIFDSIKPGKTCKEIEQVFRNNIIKTGLKTKSSIGYSIGLSYLPYWEECTARLQQGDKTILQPNMTFYVIISISMDNWEFVCGESIKVTNSGYELLTNFPRKLFLS